MAFEFGFDRQWFPNVKHADLSETEKVNVIKYVNQIMQDFDLILVNERLNECLVLMKRLLRWTIRDILYGRFLVNIHDRFSAEEEGRVSQYLYLDFILYNRAVASLDAKIAQEGSDFYEEVNYFIDINKAVMEFCNYGLRNRTKIAGTKWNRPFKVTKRICIYKLLMDETTYLAGIRYKQYKPSNKSMV